MALFIDVDGTLLDSYPGIKSSALAAFEALGLPAPTDEQLRSMPGPPLVVSFRNWGFSEPEVTALAAAYRAHYQDIGWTQAEVFPGWIPLLEEWKQQSITLCTATSKGQNTATRMLEHLGIAHYFDFIGGADEVGGTRPTKQHVIEWVLDNTGLRGQEDSILMIGDRHHDVDGARPVGIKTALVGWGYGSAQEHAQADFFASTPQQLAELVSRSYS